MKIRKLFPIRFTLFLPAFLCFVLLATCSSEKKETVTEKKTEQKVTKPEQPGVQKWHEIPALRYVNIIAVVNENNVQTYSETNDGYKPLGYLQKGDKIRLNKKIKMKIEIDGTSDFLYHFSEVIEPENPALQGWIQKKYLDIISIQQDRTITLTNSKAVNPDFFPVIIDHLNEYIGLYGPPYYLESDEEWVVFTSDRRDFGGEHGLALHLKNLPQEFDVLIYAPDESSYLTFSGEREEYNVEEYRDLLDDSDIAIFDRISPVYLFYYPAPFTAYPGKQKTEIRGKDNTLIYSAYLDYPDDPFRISGFGSSFYVQYCTDKPFYLVVYEAAFEDILGSDDGYERIPVGAFAVYPETEIWEGTLSLGPEFNNMDIQRVYLYRLDENNPEDYTQLIKGSWNNFLKIN